MLLAPWHGFGYPARLACTSQEFGTIKIAGAHHVNRLGIRALGLRRAPIRIHIYRSAHCERGYIPSPPGWCDFVSFAIRCDLCLCDVLSARHLPADIEFERCAASTPRADVTATSMIHVRPRSAKPDPYIGRGQPTVGLWRAGKVEECIAQLARMRLRQVKLGRSGNNIVCSWRAGLAI